MVGVSTAVNALAWGARSTFALFYVAMLEEFAWGRGPTALGYSLSWLGFVVFAPMAGWLSDRWGTRTVVTGGGVFLGVALALTGQVTSLAQYYLCFGVLGAAGIAGMLIPSTTIVTRWFVRSRGTAMGVLSAGGPGSAVVFYPLNAWLIATLGWRTALLAFGGIVAAATVALTLLYREPPTSGDRAGGDADTGPSRGPRVTGEAWTLRRALRSVRLWAAFIMTALGVIGFQIMATHQVAHAVDRGFLQSTVVWLFAFGAGCMMAGNLLGGWLSDRVGRGWVFVLGTVVAILGIGCLGRDSWSSGSRPARALHDVRIRLRHADRAALHDSCRCLRRAAPGRDPRRGPVGWRPGRRDRPVPWWLALRRHRELSAGVPGRVCRRRGLGRRGVVRGTPHGQRAGRAAVTATRAAIALSREPPARRGSGFR